MEREDDVGPVAYSQLGFDGNACALESRNLLEKSPGVDDYAVPDNSGDARAQNAARDQLQNELPAANKDGVAGVVSALIAGYGVELVREEIDDLALALISPLCS